MIKCIVKCSDSSHGTIGIFDNAKDAELVKTEHQKNCKRLGSVTIAGFSSKKLLDSELLNIQQYSNNDDKVYQFVDASEVNIFLLESAI